MYPVPSFYEEVGYILYHETFRAHVRESGATRHTGARIRRLLANASENWQSFGRGSYLRAYLVRHGMQHLTEAKRFAKALELLHRLHENPADREGMEDAEFQWMQREFLTRLDEEPDSSSLGDLDPGWLLDLVLRVREEFEIYRGSLRLLRHQHGNWEELVERILAADNWSASYAASVVWAEDALKDPMRTCTPFFAWPWTRAIPTRRWDCTCSKEMLARMPLPPDAALLAPFLAGDGWIRRGILGELLMLLALRGFDVTGILDESGFWNPRWEYHRAQLEDVLAVMELVGAVQLPERAGSFPGVRRAVQEIGRTLALRNELEARCTGMDESVAFLVRSFLDLPMHPDAIGKAALRDSAHLVSVMHLLFGHPSWEVRSAAGVVAGSLAALRDDMQSAIRQWLKDSDWRVRYAAMVAADSLRTFDRGRLFEEALHLHAADLHPWIRGLAAECLRGWIFDGEPSPAGEEGCRPGEPPPGAEEAFRTSGPPLAGKEDRPVEPVDAARRPGEPPAAGEERRSGDPLAGAERFQADRFERLQDACKSLAASTDIWALNEMKVLLSCLHECGVDTRFLTATNPLLLDFIE